LIYLESSVWNKSSTCNSERLNFFQSSKNNFCNPIMLITTTDINIYFIAMLRQGFVIKTIMRYIQTFRSVGGKVFVWAAIWNQQYCMGGDFSSIFPYQTARPQSFTKLFPAEIAGNNMSLLKIKFDVGDNHSSLHAISTSLKNQVSCGAVVTIYESTQHPHQASHSYWKSSSTS
jgi:hypothetical protein